MAHTIKPLADRLVVKPLEEEVQTFAGGELVLPDTARAPPPSVPPQRGGGVSGPPRGRRPRPPGGRYRGQGRLRQVRRHEVQNRGCRAEVAYALQFMRESDILAILG